MTVDQGMLESLPVFDHDSSRHCRGSSTPDRRQRRRHHRRQRDGGSALNVSASAVQQIRINQDPYSAILAAGPRAGRDPHEAWHPGVPGRGHADLPRRTAQRAQPVRHDKPPEQRRIVEGFLGGPVGAAAGRRRAVGKRRDPGQSVVHLCRGSDGIIQRLAVAVDRPGAGSPAASPIRSATETRSPSGRTTRTRPIRIRVSAAPRSRARRPPSPTTSSRSPTPSRRSSARRCSTSFSCSSATSASRPSGASPPAQAIVVNGAFTGGGGAQVDLVRTETHMNLSESLAGPGASPDPGRFPAARLEPARLLRSHQLRGHVHLSQASTPTTLDGRARTCSPSNRVTATSRSSRNCWAPTSRTTGRRCPACRSRSASATTGSNHFHDSNNVAPRFSLAYAPGNKKTNVLRLGVGVFNDRSGPVVIADVLHSQPGGLIQDVITDPGLSRPVCVDERSGRVAAAEHRAACVRRPASTDGAGQRRAGSSTAEIADALAHLHGRARLSHVPVARRQRATAAVLPDPARSGVRRRA